MKSPASHTDLPNPAKQSPGGGTERKRPQKPKLEPWRDLAIKPVMSPSTLGATLFLCAVVATNSAGAQEIRRLRTADTRLRFENTASGPRLVDLQVKDGERWSNRGVETPVQSVEIDGKQIAVEWRFDQNASSSD